MIDMTKPGFRHDCPKCEFLGRTIGGGRMHDLYACETFESWTTVIARYSDDGPDYYSTELKYAKPTGHAELWAAACLYREKREAIDKKKSLVIAIGGKT